MPLHISGDMAARRSLRWMRVVGRLAAGVTPAQAIADLNSIGAELEKEYPKEESHAAFTLARPGLGTDFLGRPIRAFVAGIMLLAARRGLNTLQALQRRGEPESDPNLAHISAG